VELPAQFKDRQKRHWDEVAEGWGAWHEWTERNFKPVTDWIREAVVWQPGVRALDIGCGAGYPSLVAARLVAPGGSVVAIDVSPRMLEAASHAAQCAGVHNINFLEMDAEDLRLESVSFDTVTNTFGLMFYPDPVRAIAEVHRVLVPGGRFAMVVWDHPATSPYFSVISQVATRLLAFRSPEAGGPGPFRFAVRDTLKSLMRHAGFSEIRVESCPAVFECASASEYCRMFGDLAWRTRISGLSDVDRARFVSEVNEAAQPYASDGRLRLVATSLCASGVKSNATLPKAAR
jgi:ubiquinone/menaquinone biosynthesis C-methylase UbiE